MKSEQAKQAFFEAQSPIGKELGVEFDKMFSSPRAESITPEESKELNKIIKEKNNA